MKRSESLSRSIEYMRRRLRNNTWTIGKRIDSTSSIMKALSVSRSTVNKAVSYFVRKGILDIRGDDGTWVVDKLDQTISTTMKQLQAIDRARRCTIATGMLLNGGVFDKKTGFVLLRKDNDVIVYEPIVGKKNVFAVEAIIRVVKRPMGLEHAADNGLLDEYWDQQEIKDYLEPIMRNKDTLEVQL